MDRIFNRELMSRYLEGGIIDWNTTVPERQLDGTTHFFSMETGELMAILSSEKALVSRAPLQVTEIMRDDGTKVLVQTGFPLDDRVLSHRLVPYSKVFAEIICARIVGGKSLKSISEEPGMPSYASFIRWRNEHKEFSEMLDHAYADKSDYLADKIMDEIETVREDQDAINKMKLKLEGTKWATQVNKPGKYAPRSKIMGDASSPLQVVIETGIRRAGDDGFNTDETAKLREVTPMEGVTDEVKQVGDEGILGQDSDGQKESGVLDMEGPS